MSDTIQAKYTLIRYDMVWTAGVAFWGILQLHMPFFICRPKVLNRTLRRTRPALRPRSPSCSSAAAAQKASSGRTGYSPGNAGAKKTTDYFFSHAIKAPFAALCKYHRGIPHFPPQKENASHFASGWSGVMFCVFLISGADFQSPLFPCFREKTALNTVLTKGWIKNSWVKYANGKLKHTSFSHSASNVKRLNPP